MTEEIEIQETEEQDTLEAQEAQAIAASELSTLKNRADLLQIRYHPMIKAQALSAKIAEYLDKDVPKPNYVKEPVKAVPKRKTDSLTKTEYMRTQRTSKRREASKLIRVIVSCMDPNKTEIEGDIISVGSPKIGTFKKFVKFNVEYHIPNIIYLAMKEKKCTVFYTVKDRKGGSIRKGRQIPAYVIDVLPQLTPSEIADLAKQQAAAGAID